MRYLLLALSLLAIIQSPAEEKKLDDREIAARFAPVFYQGLGDNPRADYIAGFDFDGDWKGDNNWDNLENRSFALRAYVYYSVVETTTHYFIHYAYFHPRDYKGGLAKSSLLDILISEGLRQAGKDSTGGLADDIALSHENDLEGCLVVAEKMGGDLTKAEVRFVETMSHNRFLKYCAGKELAGICESIQLKDQHPLIFVQPKGHGASRFSGDLYQLKNSVNGVKIYSFSGKAEDPAEIEGESIGYDLIPIRSTLWERAQKGENETYGESLDYRTRSILVFRPGKTPQKINKKIGALGSAFLGNVGFKNKARPPWAWYDDRERERPRGEWFFDPASVVAQHFDLGQDFSKTYICHPYFMACK